MILAGDVGGTNTRLAFFEVAGSTLRNVAEKYYPTQAYGGLEQIVAEFVAETQLLPENACFGVAGPVRLGRAIIPNVPWIVEARLLAQTLNVANVELINDLEAHAHSLGVLGPADLVELNAGDPEAQGNRAMIAAGTGLGEAGLYWDGERYHPFACEGGHADFAPRDELEVELLRYLQPRFGRVSYERVLSGPGLNNIYQFLRDTGRAEQPEWLREELQVAVHAAAVIANAGMEGKAPICEEALAIFVSAYGAEAGNLALKLMATGGLMVGGGIAPKILPKLREPSFMEAFFAKGRMAPLLKTMPVRVVINEKAGLIGAARCAAARAAQDRHGATLLVGYVYSAMP